MIINHSKSHHKRKSNEEHILPYFIVHGNQLFKKYASKRPDYNASLGANAQLLYIDYFSSKSSLPTDLSIKSKNNFLTKVAKFIISVIWGCAKNI